MCGHCFYVLVKQDISWCCPRCSSLLFSFFFAGLLTHIPIKDNQSVKPKIFQSMRNTRFTHYIICWLWLHWPSNSSENIITINNEPGVLCKDDIGSTLDLSSNPRVLLFVFWRVMKKLIFVVKVHMLFCWTARLDWLELCVQNISHCSTLAGE